MDTNNVGLLAVVNCSCLCCMEALNQRLAKTILYNLAASKAK